MTAAVPVFSPYPVYYDGDGELLQNGYLYFGSPNLNPETNPVAVYWDSAATQPAAQPIRTRNGYPLRGGSPGLLYTLSNCSLTVKDSRGVLITYTPSVVDILGSDFGQKSTAVLTIAELKTLSKTGPAIAIVAGYYTNGDGGGGTYYLDSADVASADNGGTVIVASDGGRWKLVITNSAVSAEQFGCKFDGVTDDTTAHLAAVAWVKGTGVDLIWPAGTSLVGTITLDGSNYNIKTAGGRRTILKQKTGTDATFGQIIVVKGQNINVGDLAFIGNIATDTGEFHHCVYCNDDAAAATIENIHFGDLYGTNIRGDVLYVGGAPARPTTNITAGTVSGTNIFRNLVSVTGGQLTVDKIIHDGPVGNGDFDFEPNVGSQDINVRVNYCSAGNGWITGFAACNKLISFGVLDLDYSRYADATPGYPTHVGANVVALYVARCESLRIEKLVVANYNWQPVIFNRDTFVPQVWIGELIANGCGSAVGSPQGLFSESGIGGTISLTIDKITANLVNPVAGVIRYVWAGNGPYSIVNIANGTISNGGVAIQHKGGFMVNLTVDCNSRAVNLLYYAVNATFVNLTVNNTGSAVVADHSTDSTLINVTGIFFALEGVGCANNVAVNCLLGGIKYDCQKLSGEFLSKAMADANQTLTASEASAKIIRTTGALTAQRNLVLPLIPRIYSIDNSCTGFGVQVIGPSGAGVVVAAGKKALIQCDGTNMVRATADV